MKKASFDITLPQWVDDYIIRSPEIFETAEERVGLAIALARENVREETGGPFGAAIFDNRGRLVAPGINMVTTAGSSLLHAEIVAIILAQKRTGRYDLSDGGRYYYELASSTEPCAMCLGAIPWSGLSALITAARDEDARRIGFDEGAKPAHWPEKLKERGIKVARDIRRKEAIEVMEEYKKAGGTIYNSGKLIL